MKHWERKPNWETKAEAEIEAACKHENPSWDHKSFDYGCSIYESALRAYKKAMGSLAEDGHSGMSWSMTMGVLRRLFDDKPLTAITEENAQWGLSYTADGVTTYQSNKYSGFFKNVDAQGTVSYNDVNRCVMVDQEDHSYHTSMADDIVSHENPITLPYYPPTDPYIVQVESFDAHDPTEPEKIWTYTHALYYITPDKKCVQTDLYYRDTEPCSKVEFDTNKRCWKLN